MSTPSLLPPFTRDAALIKVKKAQDLWNEMDPIKVSKAYTEDSIWRNRSEFFSGREKIIEFLTNKWKNETNYRLKKRLFAFDDNKIAVQFWYEWFDKDANTWKRTYGIEHWTFTKDGLMSKRQMSGNDISIVKLADRWFKDGIEVDDVIVPDVDG